MAKEKHVANFNAPMRMQGADIKTIQCRDCAYRLRQPFEFEGEVYDSGAIKARCDIYPDDNKPIDILFERRKCRHYKPEK